MVSWKEKLKDKKVLINIRQLQQPYTGVQSYIYNLVRSVVKNSPQTQFQLLTLNYRSGNTFIEDLLSYPNTKLLNHRSPSFLFDQVLFDLFSVNAYTSAVDLYFNPVNMVPYFRNLNVPHIVGVLDLCTFIVPHTTTLTLKTYYDIFLNSSLNRADTIVTISRNTRTDLSRLFSLSPKKIKVILLGIDPQFASTLRSNSLALLNHYKLKPSEYFVTLGTSPRKNMETTIAAFAKLFHSYSNLKLFIVSTSPHMFKLINHHRRLNKLPLSSIVISKRFLSVAQLKQLYKNSLGVIYCPWYEGFGLPILEAMSSHAPVITSRNSSLSEIAGSAALFADPSSPTNIAQKLKTLYLNPILRRKLIVAGDKNSKPYTWDRTANQLLEIFASNL